MYSVVGSDGQVYGPVDMATLSQWIAEGRIVATTNLIDPIDGRVIQAQQAPVLMGAFSANTGAPPSHPGQPYGGQPQAGPIHSSSSTPGSSIPGYGSTPQSYGYPRPDMMGYAGPPKSKAAAAVIAFFLGSLGIHRFYLGHTSTGVAQLVLFLLGFGTCGVTSAVAGIWAFVDFILILTGSLREPNGRALV